MSTLPPRPRAVPLPFLAATPPATATGLSGGGTMYSPVAATQDPRCLVVACDMGGLYLSENSGGSWSMFDQRSMRTPGSSPSGSWQRWAPRPVAFAPDSADLLVAAGPGRGLAAYRRSSKTWTKLPAALPKGTVTALLLEPLPPGAQDGDDARPIYVGTVTGAYLRNPGGALQALTWADDQGNVAVLPGPIIAIAQLTGSTSGSVAIATPTDVYIQNAGVMFRAARTGLPNLGAGLELTDLTVAGTTTLFASVAATDLHATSAPGAGIYLTTDPTGAGWAQAAETGLPDLRDAPVNPPPPPPVARCLRLAASAGNAQQVFCSIGFADPAGAYHRVYRSTDSGGSWTHVLNVSPDTARNPGGGALTLDLGGGWVDIPPFNPDFGGPILGLSAVGSPATVIASNLAGLYVSADDGATWQQRYTNPSGNASGQSCSGLNVTSSWNYLIHPQPPAGTQLHHISYTDIGYARSSDGGTTWDSIRLPTRTANTYYNTVYELACASDPGTAPLMWAAAAQQHDLPYDEVASAGGDVLTSTDYGASWMSSSTGLPTDKPVVSVVLDPAVPASTPQASRRLWCAVYGDQAGAGAAVWRTLDSGHSWTPCPAQPAPPAGARPYRLCHHTDGTLFCSLVATTGDGALARSADGGDTWTNEPLALTHPAGQASLKVTDYGVHPTTSATQLLCTRGWWDNSTNPATPHYGGIWKTTDSGGHWSNITALNNVGNGGQLPPYDPDFVSGFSATFHPDQPDTVIVTTQSTGGGGHGAWFSPTAGSTQSAQTTTDWQPLPAPFLNTTRATISGGVVYLTSFGGGVWRTTLPLPATPSLARSGQQALESANGLVAAVADTLGALLQNAGRLLRRGASAVRR